MPTMKLAQRLVVGARSSGQIPESKILANALLQLAGRPYVHTKTVQPNLQHHPWIVSALSARLFLLPLKRAQIAGFHHFVHHKTKMIRSQHILHVCGQQLCLIG
jgi:hypothetical protein